MMPNLKPTEMKLSKQEQECHFEAFPFQFSRNEALLEYTSFEIMGTKAYHYSSPKYLEPVSEASY